MWRSTRAIRLLALFILLVTVPAAAQAPTWRTFTAAAGLPGNSIQALAQDAAGTLWVGGDEGLASYAGPGFAEKVSETAGLEDATVRALLATRDGSLWVAGSNGLSRRRADGRWQTRLQWEAGLNANTTNALLETSDGTVWVGSSFGECGLLRWDGDAWEQILIDGVQLCVSALAEDASGRLWVAEVVRLHVLVDGRQVRTLRSANGLPAGAELRALQPGAEGTMWLGTSNGLVRLSDLSVAQIYGQDEGLLDAETFALLPDGEDGLWVGTAFGLAHLADGEVTQVLTSADGLADDRINALYRDWEGGLWVGTATGLTRLPGLRWTVETAEPLAGVAINDLLVDGSGVAVATDEGVVLRAPGGSWEVAAEGLPSRVAHALARDNQGRLWIGTDEGLAYLAEDGFQVDRHVPGDREVNALLYDHLGRLWVGTDEGLLRLDGDDAHWFREADGALDQDNVLSLWATAAGHIWIGTANGGASRLSTDGWVQLNTETTRLADNIVRDGLEDEQGNVWFATESGLSRLRAGRDPFDSGSWHTFTEPQLAGNRVNALWEDSQRPGHIWAASDGGLSLVVEEGEAQAFMRQDGLSHKTVQALAQRGDRLWIGTALGLTYHQDAGQSPQIAVDDPLVDNAPCDPACRSEGVSYRAQTAVFRYRGSDLGDLEGLRYRYVLSETDAAGDMREVTGVTEDDRYVVNLTPGNTYRFTVQAVDRHFNASQMPGPLVLPVNRPTVWEQVREQPWFPYAVGGALLAVAATFVFADRQLRRSGRYPFHDVRIAAVEEEGRLLFDFEVRRITLLPAYGPFRWIFSLLAPIERLQRPEKLPVSRVAIDTDLLSVARKTWLQCQESPEKGPLLRSTGELLYRAVFSSQELRKAMYGRLGLGRQGVRLRLQLMQHPALSGLPWELLSDGNEQGFIARQPATALVRFVEPSPQWERPEVDRNLRVLVVMAQPREADVEELPLDEQKAILDEVLGARDLVEIHYLLGVNAGSIVSRDEEPTEAPNGERQERARDLPELWEEELAQGWDVVHFVGHAGKDRLAETEDEAEVVLWCEDRRGDYLALKPDALAAMLAPLQAEQKVPKLIILSACDTASVDSQLTKVTLASGVGAVVGMQWPVREVAARDFVEHFYRTLGRHGQVDYAVSVARNAMVGAGSQDGKRLPDWAAPVLLMQAEDGQIFERT